MTFDWDDEKNTLIKETRGVSFEEIVVAIDEGMVIHVLEHPNKDKYPDQYIYLINWRGYVYAVPHVINVETGVIFLKTIYPSRHFTKLYGLGLEENNGN
ncbi:MAG: toxin [Spirochaetaceae bacterium]